MNHKKGYEALRLAGFIFLLLDVCVTSCGANKATVDDFHHYFWANYQLFNNDGAQAHTWFKKLMNGNPDMAVYKGYISFLFALGAYAYIVQLIPQLDERFKDDVEMQLIFAQALQKNNKEKESEERFITMGNRFKTDQAVVFQVARIYMGRKEPENAISAIDGFLNNSPKRPNNFIFHFVKAQIYTQLNEHEKALAAVTMSLEMHAHFDKGWLLFALLHEHKGAVNEAISGYTRYLEINKQQDPTIQSRLMQLVLKQKTAQKNMAGIGGAQSSFAQALRLFEEKNYQEALNLINGSLEKTPGDEQARLLKIKILSAMGNFSQAAETIKEWIKQKPDDQKWYHALYLLCKNGLSHQKALAMLEDISHEYPQNLLSYLYLADLNARIGNAQTALVNHAKAVEITTDPALKTKILFNMAQLHYAQQQFDQAEKLLEQGYALNQTFLPLLNLLAYHYATQSKNLKQAEKLIDEVLKVSTNPHFLDTKALVLYKKKQYKKALKILKAIEPQMPNDFSVLKHLAKTHYRLGNKEEAIKIINNAVKCAHCEAEKNKADFMIAQWNK